MTTHHLVDDGEFIQLWEQGLETAEIARRLGIEATPAIASPKAAALQRLRALHAEGLSLQAMANRFNTEGVLTLSGRGTWQKGTIGNLLAQADKE